MKQMFLANINVKNPDIVDTLLLKGKNDLEEFLLIHKTQSHVLNYFLEDYQTGEYIATPLIEEEDDEKQLLERILGGDKKEVFH